MGWDVNDYRHIPKRVVRITVKKTTLEPYREGQLYCERCSRPSGFTEQSSLTRYDGEYLCAPCLEAQLTKDKQALTLSLEQDTIDL